jgi:hypothetical protein
MADNNSDSEDPTAAELLNQLDDISTGAPDEGEILDDAMLATDSITAVDEQAITADTITEATPTITAPTITAPPGSRKRGVATAARTTSSSKKKKASAQCRKGARVKIKRSLLFHVLEHDDQKEKLEGHSNSRNFFGTFLSGSGKTGCKIRFDDLPAGNQDVNVKRRNLITVLEDGEEEKEHDHTNQLAEELAETHPPTAAKEAPAKNSTDKLCALDAETIAAATVFGLKWGQGEDKVVNWKMLGDNEHITEDPLIIPDSVVHDSPACATELTDVTDLNKLFFDEFFPSVVGHAKIIDKFHADPRSPFHTAVKNDRIAFHDPEADDPDWTVKQACALMIAAASEIENGVENLWKRGPSGGRHDHPDFGKHMAINHFVTAFQSAAPCCWCDEKHWHVDKRDGTWDVFQPCLEKMNSRRAKLLATMLLTLDESMCGWRPKTSKFGFF